MGLWSPTQAGSPRVNPSSRYSAPRRGQLRHGPSTRSRPSVRSLGVVVSVIQAATQIQEMTLTFIPKIVCMFLALLLALPWLMERMITFTRDVIINIPIYIR